MSEREPAAIGEGSARRSGRPRRWLPRVLIGIGGVVVLLVVAIVVVLVRTKNPTPGPFYTPPAAIPSQPGSIIRSEPYTRSMPAGSRAWLVLYSSTDDSGHPVAVSGLVIVPANPPAGPRPVLAWAHGTTGVTPPCGPSVSKDALAGIPDMTRPLAQGWVLVLTDYPGLGTPGVHPYMVGVSEAHAVLDSVRAAHHLNIGVPLDDRYGVWGHSQGGHAALFAGHLASAYMPEYKLVGVAALAPATDLGANFSAVGSTPVGKLLTVFALYAWSAHYPGLSYDAIIVPCARRAASRIVKECLNTPSRLLLVANAKILPAQVVNGDITTDPQWKPLFDENSTPPSIDAPVFVAQGLADQVVSPPVTHAWFTSLCAAEHRGELRDYAGVDHRGIAQAGGVDAVTWLIDRFAGTPATTTCPGLPAT